MNLSAMNWIEADRLNQQKRMDEIRKEQAEKKRRLMESRKQVA